MTLIKPKIRYKSGFWIVECKNYIRGIAKDIPTAWALWEQQTFN